MAARDRAWQADERIRGSLASAARHAADSGGLGRRGRLPDPIRDSLGPGHHPGRRCSRRSGRAAARLTAGVARPAGRLPVAGHSFGGPVAPPPSGSGHAHRGRTRPVSTPAAMSALASRLPRAALTILPGAAHMTPFTDPAALAGLILRAAGR